MKYYDTNNSLRETSAIGYRTTEDGETKDFSNMTNLSSTSKFYLVFNGKLNMSKIVSITVDQPVGTIKGRLVLSEAGGDGQNLIVFYARGKLKANTEVKLPAPPPTVITPIKRDNQNNAELKNARFVLKNLDTNRYVVGGTTSLLINNTWAYTIEGASVYKSGDKIALRQSGRYQFYEVQAENEYYKQCSKTEGGKLAVGEAFYVELGNSKSITLTNQPRGLFIIDKIDDTTKKELKNTRFVIKKQGSNQYAIGGTQNDAVTWTNNIRNATIYKPQEKICFEEEVTCELYEVQRESDAYQECSIEEPLKVASSINIYYRQSKNVSITNRRKYVKLSGCVWEDKVWRISGKGYSNLNNLYLNKGEAGEGDINDKALAHVTVKLKDKNENTIAFKDKNGNVVQEIETDANGNYLIGNVLIDKLNEYYIEFTYNGMKYQSVIENLNKENGSKATEGQYRTDFNNNYTTIVAGGSLNQQNRKTYDLKYDKTDYTSQIHYGDHLKYGYNGQKYPINGTYDNFLIKANTRNAYKKIGSGYLTDIKTGQQIRENEIDVIENINLGLKEREQPNLTLVKDLDTVRATINGAVHIYKYGDRFNPEIYGGNGTEGQESFNIEPKIRYQSKYGNMSYTRELYPSDVYYQGSDELQVFVTYKIGIKNTSSLTTVLNQINDYYDTKYYGEEGRILVGTQLDDKGMIKESSKLQCKVVANSGSNQYTKMEIQPINMRLSANSIGYVYVQLEVKKEYISDIVEKNSKNQEEKLDNIAEIASYSVKDENGNAYAGIDINSEPGNININNPKTFEDDTDKAPGLKLKLREERKIEGTVFIDSTTGELRTGEVRQGSGIYENGEPLVQGVKVRLINKKTNQIAFVHDNKVWKPAETETNQNGYYSMEGFIPEEYELVYIWGGQTYSNQNGQLEKIRVQNYKSTIYKDKNRKLEADRNQEWYKINIDTRYSDAIDSRTQRQQIDKQTEIMINNNKTVIENYNSNEGKMKLENGEESLITEIESYTPKFKINLEYKTEVTNGKLEHQHKISNIDFGIVERARQNIKLTKEVKRIKVVLANGFVLIDSTMGPNKEVESKHTTYIPQAMSNNGQIKVEIDNEILQGASLEVDYGFKIVNISEKEYLTEDYYNFGEFTENNNKDLVALKIATIIDYLDNNLTLDLNKEELWHTYDEKEKENLIRKDGLLDEKLKQTLIKTNEVAHTEQLASTELRPIDQANEAEVTLKLYRILQTGLDDNFIMDNDAEILKIIKTGGSTIVSTPGNYIPSEGVKETDEAQSETITILPPTGLETNYIAYTLLAISSLGLLISGIVLIKKFVLKK